MLQITNAEYDSLLQNKLVQALITWLEKLRMRFELTLGEVQTSHLHWILMYK